MARTEELAGGDVADATREEANTGDRDRSRSPRPALEGPPPEVSVGGGVPAVPPMEPGSTDVVLNLADTTQVLLTSRRS